MKLCVESIVASRSLPTPPAVAIRLIETTQDPNHGLVDVVKVIKSDPALSAKILRAANSSYYALRTNAASVDHAAALLGTTAVTALALSFSLIREQISGTKQRHLERFWGESLVQAVAAEMIGHRGARSGDGEAFLGGLLADLGRLALIHAAPAEYLEFVESTHPTFADWCQVEQQELELDHVDVGHRIAALWRLPLGLREALLHHHGSADEIAQLEGSENYQLIRAVALAARVSHYFSSEDSRSALDELKSFAGKIWNMDAIEIQEFLCEVRQRVDEAGSMLKVNTKFLPDPAFLLAQANEQLAHLTVLSRHEVLAHRTEMEEKARSLEVRNQELQRQAERDCLTGLFNRDFLDKHLQLELERAIQSNWSLGLLFCDLDRFKSLNDTYGHLLGDQALVKTARALERSVRGGDVVARYGGEEFVVVISNANRDVVDRVAQRLLSNVASIKLRHGGKRLRVTVSVGSVFVPASQLKECSPSRLIELADEAMYQAKHAGGNRHKALEVPQAHVSSAPVVDPPTSPTSPMAQPGIG